MDTPRLVNSMLMHGMQSSAVRDFSQSKGELLQLAPTEQEELELLTHSLIRTHHREEIALDV
jgi:hypothetical protein